MGWVEEHPFWMAMFVSIFVSLYAVMYHYLKVSPHDWNGVFMWIPLLWVIVYLIATIAYMTEK